MSCAGLTKHQYQIGQITIAKYCKEILLNIVYY